MSHSNGPLSGPDFGEGFDLSRLEEGTPVLGHKDGEQILLVRLDGQINAVGASCTHYGAPLADGIVAGDTIRCPWHHACFSLRTGEALAAPALDPLPRWEVKIQDGEAFVAARQVESVLSPRGRKATGPGPMVILGAGAAGSAAAETLRKEGFPGRIVLVDPDPEAPYDRPNLSKDYLAGTAPEEWMPLRSADFYERHEIERVIDRATRIDTERWSVELASGAVLDYGALLIALGATPRSLDVPGADSDHVHALRSWDDARRLITAADRASSAVVIGAGFIGMETAASLKSRGLDVHVVAPEETPFERPLGALVGRTLQEIHERNGVRFHLGATVARIRKRDVQLDDGTLVPADLVVVGVGVRPETGLGRSAGLHVDDGLVVDDMLQTSAAGVFAAGDLARWPDPRTGQGIRVEHWVVAQRQGQAAARNMLGLDQPFRDVPFFWTSHFGVSLSYVGHTVSWDDVDREKTAGEAGAAFRFMKDGRLQALATIDRDRLSLETEAALLQEWASAEVGP